MIGNLATMTYCDRKNQVCWQGYTLTDREAFNLFISNDVTAQLFDQEGSIDFESHLKGLASTGFAQTNLNAILSAEIREERDWAIGEAIAEAWLSAWHDIIWPWSMERDKRTPKASLPGADLIGFYKDDTETRLVLGEVKTSSEEKYPPQVMCGRSGMAHQIDKLINRLDLIYTLLKWLWPRCKNTVYQPDFDASVTAYLESGNKAISIYGVLIRDTGANELDLRARGLSLGSSVGHPTSCQLIVLYIPCKIAELPFRVKGDSES